MYVYVFYTSFMTTIRKFSICVYERQTLLASSLGRPLLIVLINENFFFVGNMPDFERLDVICINAFNLKMDLIILNILLLSQSIHVFREKNYTVCVGWCNISLNCVTNAR